MSFLTRHANEFGGIFNFNMVSGSFEITKLGEDVGGNPTGIINATWANNLISWKIFPFAARSLWGSSSQSFYDIAKGQWNKINSPFNFDHPWSAAEAIFAGANPAPNEDVANQQTEGNKDLASQYIGNGVIVINGEPSAHYNMFVQLTGARPGVDGLYHIYSTEHTYERGGGYTTTINLDPFGATGGAALFGLMQAKTNITSVGAQGWTTQTTLPNGNTVFTSALGTIVLDPAGNLVGQPIPAGQPGSTQTAPNATPAPPISF
jgi:hypothetical protein